MEKTAKVIKMVEQDDDVKVEIALIKQDINTIKDNHLAHIEKDINRIHTKVDKIDTRLWAIAAIIIMATVGPLIAGMLT